VPLMLVASMLLTLIFANPSASVASETAPSLTEDDIIQPIEYAPGDDDAPLSLVGEPADDPLGLIPFTG
jgi:hypothetical protein